MSGEPKILIIAQVQRLYGPCLHIVQEPAYGARPIKRLMQKELVNLLAKSILDGTVRRDSTILVDVKEG